jgi:hypothetical protein
LSSPPDEPFAVSPEDARTGVPPELRPGAQSTEPERAAAAEAPGGGGLKRRVIPDPPEIDQSRGRRTALFLLVLALAAAAIMAAVGALNTYADPYGLVGTRVLPTLTTSDRTLKADLIEGLRKPPQLVILGSSRSMYYEASYLQKLTGLRTFNAGVNGIGGTADAWAMTNFIHDRFPGSHPGYFWLVDVESFVPFRVAGNTAGEPRLNQYLGGPSAGGRHAKPPFWSAVWTNRSSLFSWVTAADSWRLLRNPAKVDRAAAVFRDSFLPDGSKRPRPYTAAGFARRYPLSVTRYKNLYKNVYHQMDPQAQRYFERTLALMNRDGATPVLVLTPINPKLKAIVGPLGWDARHRQVVDYLKSLRAKYRFAFVDVTDIRTYGGDPVQFFDGVHLTPVHARSVMDYVLRRTGGIPK